MLTKQNKFILTLITFSAIIVTLILLFFFYRSGFIFALLSFLPISELRGSIPVAVFSSGWPILVAYLLAILLNWLVSPLVFLFLDYLHPLFYKWNFYKMIFDRFIAGARRKMAAKVDKYGMLGIMIFIGIPFPITGAYTGTAGAWILGLNRKKTMLAALGGVIISGFIVSTICYLIQQGLIEDSFLIKKPETTH